MPSLIERITGRREKDSGVPVCPDHQLEMVLRGKVGRPARFADQTASEYRLIYICPVPDCDEKADRPVLRNQAAVPGAAPERPVFSRRND